MKAISRRDEVLEAIVQEEARLARLDSEQVATESRLDALKARLGSFTSQPQIQVTIPLAAENRVPQTAAEKVALFRSLFRGREDVFPTRFVSKKTGRSGYAPALALPVSWKGTLIQYAGRLHRLDAGKSEVRIFDYVDREVPVLARMFEKRLRGYKAIGYARQDGVT